MGGKRTSKKGPRRRSARGKRDLREPDWFLGALVDMVNETRGRVSLPITLTVGGLLITGELVSAADYFQAFAEDFKVGAEIDAIDAENAKERFANILAKFAFLREGH